MIEVKHKQNYVNGKLSEEFYLITNSESGKQSLVLTVEEAQELYQKLGEKLK